MEAAASARTPPAMMARREWFMAFEKSGCGRSAATDVPVVRSQAAPSLIATARPCATDWGGGQSPFLTPMLGPACVEKMLRAAGAHSRRTIRARGLPGDLPFATEVNRAASTLPAELIRPRASILCEGVKRFLGCGAGRRLLSPDLCGASMLTPV